MYQYEKGSRPNLADCPPLLSITVQPALNVPCSPRVLVSKNNCGIFGKYIFIKC